MKKLIPVLLLLLAGCKAHDGAEDNQTSAAQEDLLANLATTNPAQDMAHVQQIVDRAMQAALPAGAKPQYRNVRAGVGGAACGEVSSLGPKNRAGPFRHFVVTPELVAIIGTDSQIKFNDPSDFLADAWIRWCASPDELKLVEGQLDRGPAPSSDFLPPTNVPGIPEEPVAAPTPTAPTRTATSGPPPPPPPAQIDSFSKSISRPQ